MSVEKYPSHAHFKFKHLKTYTSAEWLANGQKKYRQVFERDEVDYLYAELSIHNKEFDRFDWTIRVTFTCNSLNYDGQYLKEVCRLEVERVVPMAEPVVNIREGWGHTQKGAFWQPGTYVWVATVDEVVVGRRMFYLQNFGVVAEGKNPYFYLNDLRVFESGSERPPYGQRLYYSEFDHRKTRFIWAEVNFNNRVRDNDWVCEFTYQFYNDARQHKGTTEELVIIRRDTPQLTLSSGWGSDQIGTWFPDNYTVEIIFMDQLVAVLPFSVGDEFIDDSMGPRWLSNWKPSKWWEEKPGK